MFAWAGDKGMANFKKLPLFCKEVVTSLVLLLCLLYFLCFLSSPCYFQVFVVKRVAVRYKGKDRVEIAFCCLDSLASDVQ